MEEFLIKRLELRIKRLKEYIKTSEELLKFTEGGTVAEQDLFKCHVGLKQSICTLKSDVDQYLDKGRHEEPNPLNEALETQMKAEELLIEVETIVNIARSASDTKETNGSSNTPTNLPKLDLPKFNGDVLKWTEFWDRFDSSVHSQNMKEVDKFSHLMSSLEGRAKETVEGLSITNDNYKVAVDTLKNRYGNVNKVIDSHYEALSKLKRSDNKPNQCRKNLNTIEKHLRVLASLGENNDNNHLRSLILEKFPDKVLYELNLLTSDDQTVSSIRSTLDKIIGAMERAQLNDEAQTASASTEALHIRAKPVYRRGKKVTRNPSQKPTPFTSRGAGTSTNRKRGATEALVSATKKAKLSCIFCKGPHYNDECTQTIGIQERKKLLNNRCFRCLRDGHRIKDCKFKKHCYHCKGDHNRALCPKKSSPPGNTSDKTINTLGQCLRSKSLLQTAMAQVVNNNNICQCRILLDCGSQRSYITTGLAKQLNLTPKNENLLMIFTFGAEKPTETLSPCSDIIIRTKRGIEKNVHVNIVPHITDRIPSPNIRRMDSVDILADDDSATQSDIDMLIGNDYYFSFMRNNSIQVNENLFLVDTDFGWVASGCVDSNDQCHEDILTVVTYHQSNRECACYTEPDLPLRHSDLKFLWSLENIGIMDSSKATREEEAVQYFNETVAYKDGRYFVKWPWTAYPPNLPTNYGLAYGRLKGLLQRLDGPTLQEYDEILKEQLKAEIIEVIEVDSEANRQSVPPVHYLPHHIVKHSGKRGRIVYDASAKVKDQQSLNECMYRGPCMLQDLTALLLNFRMYKIGIIADVEKAFLQVGLQEDDREVTRFLWVRDISKPLSNDNILHLRFCRVPFGVIASPFLLTATIRHHVSKKNNQLLNSIANKCYVDNLVTGTNTTTEANKLFDESKNTFQELSMNLRDWTSNDEVFIRQIPEQYRMKECDEIKVLGLLWNKTRDILRLNVNEETTDQLGLEKVTKRGVLRTLASIYDPCGIVSPLLLPVKLFLQELWRKDLKWDAPLSQDLVLKWRNVMSNLFQIKQVDIPRFIMAEGTERIENQLHCFTDAAKDSYAAVVYLRSSNGSEVKTALLISKTRVVPLERKKKSTNNSEGDQERSKNKKKPLTIPQLELLGCVIGNRLLTYVKEALEVSIARQYLWTDSLVALSWIKSHKLLPPFVANRVEEIKRNTEVEICYVNTRENPADIATRPELWSHKKHIWLKGPAFLSKDKSKWPKHTHPYSNENQVLASAVAEGLEDHSPDYTMSMETDITEEPSGLQDHSPDYAMSMETDITEEPTVSQSSTNSQVQEIKNLQQQFFPEEVAGKETSLTRNLGLFVDVDGLLRCKGRMTHADWSYDMKHPILLPRDCDFTEKVIRDVHEKNYHVGGPHTLSLVRQQFWIPKGRAVVDRIIKKCSQCVKHGGGPYTLPPPPALPAERANYSTPFTYTGIDYFGPVYVDANQEKEKRWVCLMTCLAVRAIHMEVVKNLTADECIMALRRFMSTRGVPTVIVSDNALYFKLSSEIMESEHCVKNKITWKFIPQLAPWHGGFYERLVGLVKHCMKRTLEKRLLNETQVLTVIKEIEAVVNSRPLTRIGADMDIVLKPSDFLSLGDCLYLETSQDFGTEQPDTVTKQNLIESWKRGQHMMNQFKNMFINQYLTCLRERYQHSHKQPRVKSHKEPSVGDLVQIKGDTKNRINWKVGKIVNLIRGSDGYCRVAQVRVGDSTFTRSIGHLYPLELEEPLSLPEESNPVERAQVFQPHTKETELDLIQNNEACEETQQFTEVQETMDLDPTEEQRECTEEIPERSDSISSQQMQDNSEDTHRPGVNEDSVSDRVEEDTSQPQEVEKRAAAIRARAKIAEWTRQLHTLL